MADKYSNYEKLSASEKEGHDFAVSYDVPHNSRTLLLGPHAGGIEPGTSEIILAAAGNDIGYYLFEGLKSQNNGALHITSTNFDEPRGLELVQSSQWVVAIHGERSEGEVIYLGGRDKCISKALKKAFEDAGFHATAHEDPTLQGRAHTNICNRGETGAGVQLELSKGLRRGFFASLSARGRKRPTERLVSFVAALRSGLQIANAIFIKKVNLPTLLRR